MKIKTLPVFFCLSIFFFQCGFSEDAVQTNNRPPFSNRTIEKPDFEDGKCYAKCLAPDQYAVSEEVYPVYIGDQTLESVDLETVRVVIQSASSSWVKKKADRNCSSPDPNDCLVWCLVEEPEISETLIVLKDTTQSDNYEMRRIEQKELLQKGGFTEWKEVVCAGRIDALLVYQIQESLRTSGYYSKANTKSLDRETKASLSKFQKDNNLPVGNLDMDTMSALGIDLI